MYTCVYSIQYTIYILLHYMININIYIFSDSYIIPMHKYISGVPYKTIWNTTQPTAIRGHRLRIQLDLRSDGVCVATMKSGDVNLITGTLGPTATKKATKKRIQTDIAIIYTYTYMCIVFIRIQRKRGNTYSL